MDLSSAIVWWDEWKLRILVLCSLIVHSSLLLAGYVRQSYILRSLRVLVWIAYMGGDALAIYALATLFNRQKQPTTADGSAAIEVIWAPFLLLHLGGQVQISAYSLEDNELWKRHAITLVSQVTVALYVFCKWWSGETRLLESTVLLFISGILKFSQKPWALRRASYGSMASNNFSSPPRRPQRSWLGRCIEICTTDLRECKKKPPVEGRGGIKYSLKEYVNKAKKHVRSAPPTSQQIGSRAIQGRNLKNYIYSMFLDVSAPYYIRLDYLQYFLGLEEKKQHRKLREYIDLQFSAIYTKVRSRFTCLGLCTFLVLPSLVLASAVLFAKSDKDGYDKSDITVTYILFFGTVVIELGSFFIGFSCSSLFPCNLLSQNLTWQDMVAQHNIMSFCARNKKPPTLMKLATFNYLLMDFINKHWYIWHEPKAQQISMLIRRHVEDGWKEYICGAYTYRSFNNLRGDHTLKKHQLQGEEHLGWSIKRPFDECVLLWHIATDLCLHHTNYGSSSCSSNTTRASSSHQSQAEGIDSRRHSSKIISNYMIYLLFICPDMLTLSGTRPNLFMDACHEIECMIKNKSPSSSLKETTSDIAKWILDMKQGDQRMTSAPKILDAHKLSRVLIESLDEEKRWVVIQGVWVEMLCYSASRCRGYLHTKSLGAAPEFLTNVWLLWWCMGMQTLPDIVNNLGCPEELTATDWP